ncbi:MAG TPA: ATP-grasp domain-containing protein [Candidatus Saccharimonadales bacterium]|nr:ATP-grasp domain-containing protein [Candidatus Saccharimonadales bacterium]
MLRDTILTINVVEPALVRAVRMHSKDLGYDLHGLALVDKSYASHVKRPKDKSGLFKEIVCDFDDPDELQRVLKPYMDRLLAVTCRYEEAIQSFRKVIPFLPYLHTPSPEALLWSTEKPLMRDRLRNYDSKLVPRYQYLEEDDMPQLEKLVRDFKFPVIIKPSGLSKALLVSRCEDLETLRERLAFAFRVIQDVYDRDRYQGKPAVLVEEMMEGDMYSVDAYVLPDGRVFCLPPVKVVTAHSVGLPGFYGYERRAPATLPPAELEAAYDTATAAIRALNLSATTTHIEMYRTEEGWKIIEIAARIGGHRDVLYREAYGIEHFYNDLLIRMGKEPSLPSEPIAEAAVLNLYAEREGTIKSIEGIDRARELPSVIHIVTHAGPGDRSLFSTNGGDRVVDAVLRNTDREQLEKDIRELRELIIIEVA